MKNKLRDNTGASMVMALILLLVATMVSAVVVTTAVGAAKSNRTQQDRQQAYLSVSSAAEYMRTQIKKATVTGSSGSYTVSNSRFNSLLKAALNDTNRTDTNPYKKSFVLAVDGFPDKVKVNFTMTGDGTIKINFCLDDTSKTNYCMNMTVKKSESGDNWWNSNIQLAKGEIK